MTAVEPFRDLLVVDFTHVLAGPACAYYLGLLGADVIKVESLDKGDAIRHRGGTDAAAAAQGMSTAYLTQAAGKRSLAIDLQSDSGKDTLHRLLSRADVLVENHRPQTLRALGLDESVTIEKYPRLIHCALTGYGRHCEKENAPAYDVNIQAACGLMELTGTDTSGPTRTGAPVLDYSTALAASFAISAALLERHKTGRGGFIDVSMLETGLTLMSSTITDYLKTGNAPQRRGNLANSRSVGAGCFECKTGMISLGVNEETHFINLAKVLERTDWLTDPRFAERAQRKQHADEFVVELTAELARYDAGELETAMQNAGVPAAVVRTLPQCLTSEEVSSRGYLHEDKRNGLQTPGLPFRFYNTASQPPKSPPPAHGEHRVTKQ